MIKQFIYQVIINVDLLFSLTPLTHYKGGYISPIDNATLDKQLSITHNNTKLIADSNCKMYKIFLYNKLYIQ